MQAHSLLAALALLSFAIGACERTVAPITPALSRDSAGVRIVVNTIAGLPMWSLVDSTQIIGVVDGEAPYQFDRIRAAFRLADGRLVVANGGTLDIRYYDQAGKHVRTVGGRGGGPGEYQAYGPILLHTADSLLVFDNQNRRVTVYDALGRRVGEHSTAELPLTRRFLSLLDISEGRLVLRTMIEPATHTTGYRRDTAAIVTVRLDNSEVDTLTHVPTIEWVQRIQSDGGRVSIGLPFAYSAIIMRWKRGYLLATREGYEFRRIRPDGTLDLIVRRSDSPLVPVSRAMRDRWLDSAQAAEKKAPPTEIEFPSPKELIDAVPTNRALWAHGSIHVDGLERVWVEDFRPQQTAADSAFGHWTVFDSSGVAIARATLPRSLTIRHIAADHVVGTVRDSLEVEFVVVRAIKR